MNTIDTDWEEELDLFWEAMRIVFQPTQNKTCGSHVHITPQIKIFTVEQLKSIAFAIITQEHLIRALLPAERDGSKYCKMNSKVSSVLKHYVQNGKNKAVFEQIRTYVKQCTTKEHILHLMQGSEDGSRYVIWNFKNIVARSNTIEFRGGRHLRGPVRTKWWIAFPIAFISMALRQVRRG